MNFHLYFPHLLSDLSKIRWRGGYVFLRPGLNKLSDAKQKQKWNNCPTSVPQNAGIFSMFRFCFVLSTFGRHLFFFFHWHYSPLWALACRIMSIQFFLSPTNSLHLLTPSTWRSLSASSFHLFLGCSPSSRPFQFLSEDLFRHPILLHSL